MFGTLLRKVFGSKNDRELKRIQPLIDQINQHESALTNLSLEALRAHTTLLRERLAQGAPPERGALESAWFASVAHRARGQ